MGQDISTNIDSIHNPTLNELSSFTYTPEGILALAYKLHIPDEIILNLQELLTPEFLNQNAELCYELTNFDTASNACCQLEERLPSSSQDDGMALLAAYLAAGYFTAKKYIVAGIDESIFYDTLSCLNRFLQDSRRILGHFVFDRAFWAWRQLSCTIIRLGTLEYEYYLLSDNKPIPPNFMPNCPTLKVHIPSDACFTDEELRRSYQLANTFCSQRQEAFYRNGKPRTIICNSWLLSPNLTRLLSPISGIARFASDYHVYYTDEDDELFYRWLFNGIRQPELLPQNTSLQRAVAAHLKQGGKIGTGYGIMRSN